MNIKIWLSVSLTVFAAATPIMAAPAAAIHLTPQQQTRLNIATRPPKTVIDRTSMPEPAVLAADPSAVSIISAPVDGKIQAPLGGQFPGLLAAAKPGVPLAAIMPSLTAGEITTLKLLLVKTRVGVDAAKVAAATAQEALHRAEKLYKSDQAVSLQTVENARSAYAQARAVYRSDRALESSVIGWIRGGGRAGGIPILSTASGQIVKILAHPGQNVLAGDPLFNIMDPHDLLLRMFLPVNVLPPAKFTLTTRLGKRTYHPQFIGIAGHASKVTGGAVLLARIHAHGHLRPGMPATVWITSPMTHPRSGFYIPQRSIVWWGGGRWVFMQTAKDVFTPVRLVNSSPLPSGRFVPALPHGGLVVRGAQYLLSIEQSYSLKKSG